LLTYSGTSEIAENITKGQPLPKELENESIYTQKILEELNSGTHLEEIPNDITFDEFKQALMKWNERTTTSPSGRHLGHSKLVLRLPVYDNNDKTINISQKILSVYYQMMMIAATTGNTLERWCHVLTCMIEKIKGNPRIDKLSIIHLFETDYNLLL
jgi:hypothetical protein